MNCERIQELMPMLETGELSGGTRRRIEAHLSRCEVCREYERNMRVVMDCARQTIKADRPGRTVIRRIRAAAGEQPAPRVWFPRAVIPAAACAAACLLTAAAVKWFAPAGPAADAIGDISALVQLVSEHDLSGHTMPDKASAEERLRVLANQLLIMEGLADDMAEAERAFFMDEEVNGRAERPPTAFRSRSIRASSVGKYA